jgi:hypothetical protein
MGGIVHCGRWGLRSDMEVRERGRRDGDDDDDTSKATSILLYRDRVSFAQYLIGTSRLNVQNLEQYYAVCGPMGS